MVRLRIPTDRDHLFRLIAAGRDDAVRCIFLISVFAADVKRGGLRADGRSPADPRPATPPPDRARPPTCRSSCSIAPWTRGPRASAGRATMSLSDDDHACPVCGGPMRLVTTIRRVPGEQTLVVQCRPYGLSTTETIDAPSRARARIDNAPPGRFSVYCGCGAGTSRQRAYKPAANGPPRASPSSDGRCPRVASAGELLSLACAPTLSRSNAHSSRWDWS